MCQIVFADTYFPIVQLLKGHAKFENVNVSTLLQTCNHLNFAFISFPSGIVGDFQEWLMVPPQNLEESLCHCIKSGEKPMVGKALFSQFEGITDGTHCQRYMPYPTKSRLAPKAQ